MEYWTQAAAALSGHEWLKVKRRGSKYRPGGEWLDNIFCIDTETTSAFLTPAGDLIPFDFEKPESFWQGCEKFGWCYIWIVGVDDRIFYGRTGPELLSFFELLDDLTGHAEKIVYCHNLSFDWHTSLRDALPFDKVFARTKRKVLTADASALHLHFRCSYFLVNMSLANWAKSKKLKARKLEGDLDYLQIRTPLDPLTDQELAYCENDVAVMLEGLPAFREKYGHVFKIPLTQTGETRIKLAEVMANENRWKYLMRDLIPKNLSDYRYMMEAFFGGDVHGNYYLADRLLHGVRSCDFASSYPWVMLSCRFPITYFVRVTKKRERFMRNPNYCYLITFDAFGIVSKLHNTFLSSSRCRMVLKPVIDNGRIVKADFVQCTMTNLDFEMFQDYYKIRQLEIIEFKVAAAGYLNPELCRFVLSCYENKTQYKGVKGMEAVYLFDKQIVNGIYGDMVTRLFADDTTWSPESDWGLEPMTEEKYQEKAAKLARNFPKLYKTVQLGIWTTAAARRNLWRYMIEPLDRQVCYFDTDCVKFIGNDIAGAISSYNMQVIRQHYSIAERLEIDPARLSPADPSGACHPIGCAELEAVYEDFKTCGAKKYACREAGGPIEITVAGVPKGCASDLKTVDDLSDDFVFPPSNEPGKKKSILHYMDDQRALQVGDWTMTQKHGICLQPTGYKVGLTADYVALILANKELYTNELTNLYEESTQ